jgi:NADH-quinone oxidoreductase subunit F
MLTPDHLEVGMDYESMAAAGTTLGASSIIVIPPDMCIPRAVWRGMQFYEHESCGKCTPCREGTFWMRRLLERIEEGAASTEDIDVLGSVADGSGGFKSLCALAEFAVGPVISSLKYFRHEYEEHVSGGACPLPARIPESVKH